MGPPGGGGMGPPQHRGMAGGMQGFPQGMNGGAWQRGMTPGQPGMGAGQFGGYPAGPHGGGMSGYGERGRLSLPVSAHLGLPSVLLLRARSLLCSSSLDLVDALVVFGQRVRGCRRFFMPRW